METGYRYNRDSFVLADFFNPDGARSVADFCAGVGVVSILAGLRAHWLTLTAVELQPGLAALARENAMNSGVSRYRTVAGDIMDAPSLFRGRMFDAVISNPPYRKKGSGRINPDPAKALARHEIRMTLKGLVRGASQVLRDGGTLNIVMLRERLDEYAKILGEAGFGGGRLREVASLPGDKPGLFLSEAVLGASASPEMEPTLYLKSPDGGDSEEFLNIMARYGL